MDAVAFFRQAIGHPAARRPAASNYRIVHSLTVGSPGFRHRVSPDEVNNERNNRYHDDGDEGVNAVNPHVEQHVEDENCERDQGDGQAEGKGNPFEDIDFFKENERPG